MRPGTWTWGAPRRAFGTDRGRPDKRPRASAQGARSGSSQSRPPPPATMQTRSASVGLSNGYRFSGDPPPAKRRGTSLQPPRYPNDRCLRIPRSHGLGQLQTYALRSESDRSASPAQTLTEQVEAFGADVAEIDKSFERMIWHVMSRLPRSPMSPCGRGRAPSNPLINRSTIHWMTGDKHEA